MSLHTTMEHALHHHHQATRAVAYLIAGIKLPSDLYAEAMHRERNFTQWNEFSEQSKVSSDAVQAALRYRIPARPSIQPPERRELDLISPVRIFKKYEWMFDDKTMFPMSCMPEEIPAFIVAFYAVNQQLNRNRLHNIKVILLNPETTKEHYNIIDSVMNDYREFHRENWPQDREYQKYRGTTFQRALD